jgi:hypothetical protein
MPIKSTTNVRIAADCHYKGKYGVGLAIPPNDEAIYFGNDALGTDSLYPLDNLEASSLAYLSGVMHPVSRTALLSSRPCAFTDLDIMKTEDAYGTMFLYSDNRNIYSRWNNIENKCNLDKAQRAITGNIFRFEDSAGQPHSVICDFGLEPATVATTRITTTNVSYITLVQGDGLTGPSVSVALSELTNSTLYMVIHEMKPLFVDAANKKIYFMTEGRWAGGASYYAHGHPIALGYLTYTTVGDGGSLSLGSTFTQINPSIGTTGEASYTVSRQLFYFGQSSVDGSHIIGVRNQNTNGNSGGQYTTNVPRWHSAAYLYIQNHAWYINKINPTTNAVTLIATLTPVDLGFANVAPISRYAITWPTHFEPSPIAGEESVKYSYCFGFNARGTTPRSTQIYALKWDTATDTFTNALCTTDINLINNYEDPIDLYDSTAVTTPNYEFLFNLLAQGTVVTLTNDGNGGLFLSFHYEFNGPYGVGFNGGKTTNWVSYEIDTSDMLTLTHHSTVAIPDVYKSIHTNADCTEMMVIRNGSASVVSWSNAGWIVSANKTGNFVGVTKDHNDNYWCLGLVGDPTADSTWNFTLDLLNPTLPNAVTVRFEDSSISYAGLDLTRNILVSAYNTAGERVETNCTLKITGNSATFQANAARVLSVITSDSEELVVPITIVGPGFVNVSASFDL